jgi:hypothetical protein
MSGKNKVLLLAVLNFVGYLGTVIVNALANILPINGKYTGELSDAYPNLFVPAGLTFSIWGVIYILLAVFTIQQLVMAARVNEEKAWPTVRLGYLFFISSLANIGWIFAWHYQAVPLSMALMLVILGTLLASYLRLRIGRPETRRSDKLFVYPAFSVYLGWITIATIANVTAVLVNAGLTGLPPGEQFWTVLVISVGILITLAVIFTRQDIFYGLVVDWAILGILLKRLALPAVPAQGVVAAAIAGLVLISAGIIIQSARRKIY